MLLRHSTPAGFHLLLGFGRLRTKMSKAVQSLSSRGPRMIQALLRDGKPKLDVFLKYAKVELTPPSPGDIPAIRSGIQRLLSGFRTRRWKELTVRDAWINTLVATEVACWFFVGECIGKQSIVGYKV